MATRTVCACNMLRENEIESSWDDSAYRQIGMVDWIEHTEGCITGEDVASTLDTWVRVVAGLTEL